MAKSGVNEVGTIVMGGVTAYIISMLIFRTER